MKQKTKNKNVENVHIRYQKPKINHIETQEYISDNQTELDTEHHEDMNVEKEDNVTQKIVIYWEMALLLLLKR